MTWPHLERSDTGGRNKTQSLGLGLGLEEIKPPPQGSEPKTLGPLGATSPLYEKRTQKACLIFPSHLDD